MKQWEKDAAAWALEKFDYILDIYRCSEFIEYTGKIGGDVLTYRYYSNGLIGEK